MPAGVTPIEIASEGGRATARDRTKYRALLRTQPRMLLDKGVTLRVEDSGTRRSRAPTSATIPRRIDRMPCAVMLLPVPKTSMSFYDSDEYERLLSAASALDATAHLIVLLGGEAGLRCGEMIALEWRDVDLGKRQICVQRSDWNGQVTTPKGGPLR
jgi:integrase